MLLALSALPFLSTVRAKPQRRFANGKIKALYEELDWTSRLLRMRQDFPDAPVILIKGGILPESLQKMFSALPQHRRRSPPIASSPRAHPRPRNPPAPCCTPPCSATAASSSADGAAGSGSGSVRCNTTAPQQQQMQQLMQQMQQMQQQQQQQLQQQMQMQMQMQMQWSPKVLLIVTGSLRPAGDDKMLDVAKQLGVGQGIAVGAPCQKTTRCIAVPLDHSGEGIGSIVTAPIARPDVAVNAAWNLRGKMPSHEETVCPQLSTDRPDCRDNNPNPEDTC